MATRQEFVDQLKALGYVETKGHKGQSLFGVKKRQDMRIVVMVHSAKVEQWAESLNRWVIIASGLFSSGGATPCQTIGGSQRVRIGAMVFDCKGEVQL